MEEKHTICAVVVTYNRMELLKKCVLGLLCQEGAKCDIIVVNNNSIDGTEEMMLSEFRIPQVLYYNTGKNLGGAGGFEFGLREALDKGYKYIWLMDDDTLPNVDALEKLVRADELLKGNWGILGSIVHWTDGTVCKANRQKKSIFNFVSDKELYNSNLIRIKMTSFVSMFVKAEVVKNVGLPKKEYVIWSDDYDFSGRISKKYPVYAVSNSIVVHAMKENKKPNIALDNINRLDRYKYLYRNDVDCYKQFGIQGWIYILLKDVYSILNVLINSKENKAKRIEIIWKGFLEGLRFKTEISRVDRI